jgi:hypothetical protein
VEEAAGGVVAAGSCRSSATWPRGDSCCAWARRHPSPFATKTITNRIRLGLKTSPKSNLCSMARYSRARSPYKLTSQLGFPGDLRGCTTRQILPPHSCGLAALFPATGRAAFVLTPMPCGPTIMRIKESEIRPKGLNAPSANSHAGILLDRISKARGVRS